MIHKAGAAMVALALGLALNGCRTTRRTTTAASPSPSVSASPSPSPAGPCAPSTGGIQTHAYLTDVKLEENQGFDRISFAFKPAAGTPPGVPTYEVSKATPPFVRDPTDERFEVTGAYHVGVIFHGGTGVEISGETPTIHYKGAKEFKPAFDVIVEAEESGDFEATLQWVIGTIRSSCPKATVESNPDRLVLDFPH
jgi:hypothetical protein